MGSYTWRTYKQFENFHIRRSLNEIQQLKREIMIRFPSWSGQSFSLAAVTDIHIVSISV